MLFENGIEDKTVEFFIIFFSLSGLLRENISICYYIIFKYFIYIFITLILHFKCLYNFNFRWWVVYSFSLQIAFFIIIFYFTCNISVWYETSACGWSCKPEPKPINLSTKPDPIELGLKERYIYSKFKKEKTPYLRSNSVV